MIAKNIILGGPQWGRFFGTLGWLIYSWLYLQVLHHAFIIQTSCFLLEVSILSNVCIASICQYGPMVSYQRNRVRYVYSKQLLIHCRVFDVVYTIPPPMSSLSKLN